MLEALQMLIFVTAHGHDAGLLERITDSGVAWLGEEARVRRLTKDLLVGLEADGADLDSTIFIFPRLLDRRVAIFADRNRRWLREHTETLPDKRDMGSASNVHKSALTSVTQQLTFGPLWMNSRGLQHASSQASPAAVCAWAGSFVRSTLLMVRLPLFCKF